MIEKEVITNRMTRYYVGGGKWLTQNYPTCYREWHKQLLITDGKGLEDWREADDAEKAAWERNPPIPAQRNEFTALVEPLNAKLNDRTGYYEQNWIYDITEAQMRDIYAAGQITNDNRSCLYAYKNIRTHLPHNIKYSVTDGNRTFTGSKIETINCGMLRLYDMCLADCKKLRKARLWSPNSRLCYSNFQSCEALEELMVESMDTNPFSLQWSPLLNLASFRCIVEKTPASNTTTIPVSVHEDVYAKMTGDTTNAAAAAALTAEELAAWGQVMADGAAKNLIFSKPN